MKKIFVLFVLCGLTSIVFSQMPGNFQRNGQMPAGRFYGKIVDASGKGIEAASVILLTTKMDSVTKKPKEIVAGGMLTTNSGDFSIENVPLFGRYKLKVSGIGFKTIVLPVAFEMPKRNGGGDPSAMLGALDKDLGNIKLEIDSEVLGTVTVTASKPLLQLGIDRKVFNVDKNLVSAGGSAVDVMRNVPSLNVDIDGNVTLRNAAPQIFVDGRPTNLTLDQIPADAIESVEIITNPSAKFDASGGTAGILNIVLKKNKRVGYSGNIRANIDSRGKTGGGGDINIRQNKVNFFASGMYNQRKSVSTGITDRTDYGDTSYHSIQNDKTIMNGVFGFGRAGFDFFIDNRNTLTVNGSFAKGHMSPELTSNTTIDSVLSGNIAGTELQKRFSNSTNLFKHMGTQLSFKHNFPKSGHEWTADATYNKGNNSNTNLLNTNYYDQAGGFKRTYQQTQSGSGNNENLIIQTDYSNPITDKSKIELGARSSMRTVNSQTDYFIAGKKSSTIYNSTDNIYAAYATFSNKIKNFGYQLGLRAESSNYQGKLPVKGESFNTQFPISLFPSFFLSQKISENDEVQLNYSRRINRPGFWQLFPFTNYSDSLNISRGNPALKPEFTNSLELSYSKVFKNRDNLLGSVYFKNTNNLITRFQNREFDTVLDRQTIVNTYINANRSYITGLELTAKNKITTWWDLATNFNLFTAKIDLNGQPAPPQFVSYFAKINNSFKLPKNFSLQLSANYQSKIISSPGGNGGHRFGGGGFDGNNSTAQGYIRPNFGMDAAIRFEFLKEKRGSLSLNVNDILGTRKYDSHTESAFFVQDAQRIRDAQVFRLNFNWRFGKFDANLFKRKDTKAENNVNMENVNF